MTCTADLFQVLIAALAGQPMPMPQVIPGRVFRVDMLALKRDASDPIAEAWDAQTPPLATPGLAGGEDIDPQALEH